MNKLLKIVELNEYFLILLGIRAIYRSDAAMIAR